MRFATPEYVEVTLARIIAPGNVRQRQKAEHVRLLAASIRELGDKTQNAIVARKVRGGWEIIEGRDRFSALLLNGARETWVHVVAEATDLELLKCEIHENLHRRNDDKAALTKALVDRAEGLVRSHVGSKSPSVEAAHRPESARGEARRIVAEATGTSKHAVAKRDLRAQAREEGAAGSRAEALAAPPPPLIETWGAPLSDEVRTVVVAQQAAFREVDRLARQAQAALTKLREVCPISGAEQRLSETAHQLGALARALMPTHLCPYCKGVAGDLTCKLCGDRGYARAEQMADVPPELLGAVEADASIAAAGLDADPAPVDCAHAYRKGGASTGICLNCGAAGAANWTAAGNMPAGTAAPQHEPDDAGWTAHGPGSDRRAIKALKLEDMTEAELMDALAAAPENSAQRLELKAAVHELQGEGNPCGCYSCNYMRRLRGVPEVHPGAAHKAKAKAARRPRVVMIDGHEVTDDEGAALLGEGDGPWTER